MTKNVIWNLGIRQTQGGAFMKRALVLVLVSVFSACVPVQVAQKPNVMLTARCVYPVITPLPSTEVFQAKGGITISIEPNTFECSESFMKTSREIPTTIFDMDTQLVKLQQKYGPIGRGNSFDDYKLVETTSTPIYVVKPERISFRVKINNQMSRVFRGAGTVVLYNFGGRNTSVTSQDYLDLSNLIVPPRTEQEVTIYGPSFKDIPADQTIGIFLYDVVTKTDNAGNIIEKQNFEWYYMFQTQVKEANMEVVTSRAWERR